MASRSAVRSGTEDGERSRQLARRAGTRRLSSDGTRDSRPSPSCRYRAVLRVSSPAGRPCASRTVVAEVSGVSSKPARRSLAEQMINYETATQSVLTAGLLVIRSTIDSTFCLQCRRVCTEVHCTHTHARARTLAQAVLCVLVLERLRWLSICFAN